ncbi:replication initiator protein [Sigmofec virus UA08Rod_5935]|uniref:Replication initiator protein n=1 Tax=Sigmofec virus UA08Rod_5935 TaxID=2929446 RepID=A0A976N0V8_9VIRU|nr:replication initiator protein [Sigmofec virus UA08Rod_5935]
MSCTSPLKGVIIGKDIVTGKKIVKVLSRHDDSFSGYETFPIPCGNCMECRLEYSRQWANRCMMEAKYHERSVFVTLTYNDLHVPRRLYRPKGSFNSKSCFSLCKRDLQLFFKRLRKKFPACHIRYFGCGEYGPDTLRPHYHAILFGVDFPDKELLPNKSKTGQVMYSSKILDKLWSFPPRLLGESYSPNPDPEIRAREESAGMAIVQDVTWETCAYTARYVTKKLKGPYADFYKDRNMEPPFCCMSRRPGIARQYYDDHPDLWDYDFIHVSTPDGGKKFRPPKYFDRLYSEDQPELAEAMKEVRAALAKEQEMLKNSRIELDSEEYLDLRAEVTQDKINMLGRNGVK